MIITNIKGLYGLWAEGKERAAGAEMAQIPMLEDAYLIIEDALVKDFGPMSEFSLGRSDYDATGRYVIPAFGDSHTHLVYSHPREQEWRDRIEGLSYEDIAKRGGGILNSAIRVREASQDELFESALQRINAIRETGTGAVEVKSGYGLSMESELKMLRVIKRLKEASDLNIKATLLAAHAVPVEYKGRQGEYVKHIVEDILPAAAAEGLVDYIDSFCDRGFFTVDQTRDMLEAAAKYGIRGKIHANELAPSGGVELGCEMGCLSVDHLEEMDDKALEALKEHTLTMPTGLPQASLFLGIAYTPLRRMIDSGLAVALASDFNPGSAPSGNMQLVGSLGCIGSKILPLEALTASTLNSSAALGAGQNYGAIRKGCKANLLITKKMPSIDYIYYSFGENNVERVILNK